MSSLKAEFVVSSGKPDTFPSDRLPEVAFLGRSNVGKSSLINALTGHRKLAFTSNTPGRTQTINFYRIDEAFHLVDLPGYGYARVPKGFTEQRSEEHTSELQSLRHLVCRLLLEKKKK